MKKVKVLKPVTVRRTFSESLVASRFDGFDWKRHPVVCQAIDEDGNVVAELRDVGILNMIQQLKDLGYSLLEV